jgi:23S rRNA (cytidine1920-2'-O)/16S rRNA (cytidine1409-2'-O)-methyltransferase
MRTRLDAHLVAIRAFASRARAQSAIAAGLVRVDGVVARKPSLLIAESSAISVDGDVHDFVSRGGVKLAAALDAFAIDPSGLICLDLGASTGGFSDVLLRRGAAKVYAADVGRGQLHERIAADPRVVSLEKTHARDLSCALIPEPVDLIVCDVSFISLKKALPPALTLANRGARLVALVKPQFEVGASRLRKGGLVDASDAEAAARDIRDWMARRSGWRLIGLIESPIQGGDGNREFLLGATRDETRDA